jgi:hypothetical protein
LSGRIEVAWRGSERTRHRQPKLYSLRMDDSSYKGGGTPGGRWGCAAAALIGAPVFIMLTVVDALGDCVPGARCSKGLWSHVVLPTAIVAVVVGVSVGWIVGRLVRWRGSDR